MIKKVPAADLRAMQNPYEGPAFGGQAKEKTFTDSRGPIDLSPTGGWDASWLVTYGARTEYWNLIANYDTNDFQTGTIGAEAFGQTKLVKVADQTTIFINDFYIEIRALGYIAGNGFLLATASLGHKLNLPDSRSAGQFRHVITEGQMPDRIELQARVGSVVSYSTSAANEYNVSPESILQVSTWVRFRR